MVGYRLGKRRAEHGELWYAGFWPRLGATLIDGLVLAPITVLQFWLLPHSRTGSIALQIPLSLVAISYEVILLARYGQTVGKMAMRVAVFRVNGDNIGWREVALRCSVDSVLGLAGSITYVYAMTRLPATNWNGGWLAISTSLLALQPRWSRWLNHALNAWTLSELITLLFNRRRRALHDFIAGTVVVRVSDQTR